jgi:hypothetical protein
VWIPTLQGQLFLVLDTTRIPLMINAGLTTHGFSRFAFKTSLDYSLTGSLLSSVNGPGPGADGQFVLQQGLRYSWTVEKPQRFTLSNSYSHRLGIQCYFDSTSRICPDENIFRTRLEYSLKRWAAFSLDSELNTRLLNSWETVRDGSGQTCRVLTSSFLTPLVWNLAGGLTLPLPRTGSVMLGLTGGRLTLLRDTSVFARQEIGSYYGVKRGTNHLVEYGISLRFQVDRKFWRVLRWTCDLLLFKAFDSPADLNLKNMFEIRLASFVVISVQTRLLYEEDMSRKLQVENMLSAGFSVKR